MSQIKLIDQLNCLDAAELNEFHDFVHSPFHNTNLKIQNLFSYIQKNLPEIKMAGLNKKAAYKSMYGGKKYDDSKLRAMLSLLSKLLEDYLALRQIERDAPDYSLLLTDAFQQLGMDKYYSRQLQKMQEQQELTLHRDIQWFFHQHRLEERNYNFAVSRKAPAIGKSLNALVHHLDVYYLASRLKFGCEMLNRKNILGEEFDTDFLEALMKYLNANPLREIPIVGIYFKIIETFREPEREEHFNELLALLEKHSALFPPAENKVMYGYAMNYCIKKINTGKSEYLEKVFRLYELLIKHDAICEGAFISQWDYKNIVTTALRLNKTEWTDNFIHQFKELLHPDLRANAFKYNFANLNYFKGNFEKTMLLLREVQFTDMSYELSSKSLLLKTYFELNEYEALFNHAETFKLFLRRNKKISDYQKSIYKNLIHYIVKFSKLKSLRQRVPKAMMEEIENSKDIADKTWLMSKIPAISPSLRG